MLLCVKICAVEQNDKAGGPSSNAEVFVTVSRLRLLVGRNAGQFL